MLDWVRCWGGVLDWGRCLGRCVRLGPGWGGVLDWGRCLERCVRGVQCLGRCVSCGPVDVVALTILTDHTDQTRSCLLVQPDPYRCSLRAALPNAALLYNQGESSIPSVPPPAVPGIPIVKGVFHKDIPPFFLLILLFCEVHDCEKISWQGQTVRSDIPSLTITHP